MKDWAWAETTLESILPLSHFHVFCRYSTYKKVNPVLFLFQYFLDVVELLLHDNKFTVSGEIFRCWYPIPSLSPPETVTTPPISWCGPTDLVFLAEQVSHHPPVSAFYAECQARNISFTGHIYTKSAFLGMSVAVRY